MGVFVPRAPRWSKCGLCAGTDARLHLLQSSLSWGRGGEPRSGRRGVDKCALKYLLKTLTIANFARIIPWFTRTYV